MKKALRRAVPCYSRNEIYARLAWLLQPSFYGELGPAALIAVQIDENPWPTSPKNKEPLKPSADPFAEEAFALKAAGVDPMVSLLDEVLQSAGEDRDLICSLAKNVYGVLRAPTTRPAEPEALAHSLLSGLTNRTSAHLWSGVTISSLGDTPGLLITHCFHALAQAEQLGSGQLAVFDEVDRAVVQMRLAEEHPEELDNGSSAAKGDEAHLNSEETEELPTSLIDKSKLPISHTENKRKPSKQRKPSKAEQLGKAD